MTPTDTAIAVAPIVAALQPLVTAAVSTAVAGGVGIAVALYNSWKWRGTTIDAAHQAAYANAIGNEAAKIVAGAVTTEFGNVKVDVGSSVIAAAVDNVTGSDAKNIKDALVRLGITPDVIASDVLAEVGKAQIRIVSGAPVVTAGAISTLGVAPASAPGATPAT